MKNAVSTPSKTTGNSRMRMQNYHSRLNISKSPARPSIWTNRERSVYNLFIGSARRAGNGLKFEEKIAREL